jgi:hypothetical protein
MKPTALTASLLAILLIVFTFVSARSETIVVKGKVTDSTDGNPIPGCAVIYKVGNSEKGFITDTDLNGDYTIETEKGKSLVFSYIGFEQKTVKVTTAILNVVLEPDDSLDGISVIVLNTGGRRFLKRVEHNFINNAYKISNGKKILKGKEDGFYNLNSKTDVEKLLFGDFNAKLEFFVEPSFEGAYGFRIVRDSLEISYLLELKRINNFDEVSSQPSKEYKVDTKYFPVKNEFAEKLYVKVVDAIDNFKDKGRPDRIMDGYTATFRCVVDDEVWTLAHPYADRIYGQTD